MYPWMPVASLTACVMGLKELENWLPPKMMSCRPTIAPMVPVTDLTTPALCSKYPTRTSKPIKTVGCVRKSLTKILTMLMSHSHAPLLASSLRCTHPTRPWPRASSHSMF